MDKQTDRRMDRFPLYRASSPLGPLPCLLPNYHRYVDDQGKGAADHLLPLGDFFRIPFLAFFASSCHLERGKEGLFAVIREFFEDRAPQLMITLCRRALYNEMCFGSEPLLLVSV